MITLSDQCQRLKELTVIVQREDGQRADIKYSPEYLEITDQIELLQESQKAMLSAVPDTSIERDNLTQEVIAMMVMEGLESYEDITAKYREKKDVNTVRVLHVLDGDIDNFAVLAKITQVDLREMAKTMPSKKAALMDCIEVVSRDIVDLIVPLPQS